MNVKKPSSAVELAESIVETVRESLLVLDRRLVVRLANRSFYRTFAVDASRTLGRRLADLGEGQWNIPELLARLAALQGPDGAFEDFQVTRRFPGAGRRTMALNARRLRLEGEDLLLLAIEDQTDRRRMEDELQRSNAELEQFASVASHDLQEPLRMVVSYLQLLTEEHQASLPPEAREYVDFAADGGRRMQKLVADLLDYARAGRGELPREEVRLADAVDDALVALSSAVAQSGAVIKREELPIVRGERWQLAQLFQNLIGNALKFRAARAPAVSLLCENLGDTWRVIVEDNGMGMDPRHFERVFAVFERLHGREVPGTGIGLALCRRIVERHGGKIWVESSSTAGSRIAFTLPASGENE